MKAALLECKIDHSRLRPKKHVFRCGSFMFLLDIADTDKMNSLKLLSSKDSERALYHFVEADYLPGPSGSLFERLQNTIYSLSEDSSMHHINASSITQVMLLSNLRVLNYIFNPISLYICFAENQKPLCVLVEVENTFHERKPFLVPLKDECTFEARLRKHFYVSPYSDVEQYFRFRIQLFDQGLSLLVDSEDENGLVLRASLAGTYRELNDANVCKLTLRYPLVTLRTIFLIYYQAFLLWLKRTPFYYKQEKQDLQLGILQKQKV